MMKQENRRQWDVHVHVHVHGTYMDAQVRASVRASKRPNNA